MLDLSRILSGPFATMTLADLGADVIKIEDPVRGDDTRTWGPPFVAGESSYFLSVNRNKRSVAVDLKDRRGLELVRSLALAADVVVENFRPGTADRLGLGYEELAHDNPGLVYASVSGYGQHGPDRDRPGYDAIAQAESGFMSLTGEPDGEPIRAGIATADLSAGMWTVIGILAALNERNRTGSGQHLDVGLVDSQISMLTYAAGAYFTTGEQPARHGSAHPNIAPYQPLPTADGSVMVAVGNDVLFRRFVEVLDLAELADDGRFASNPSRVEHRIELDGLLSGRTSTQTTAYWMHRLAEVGVPAGRIADLRDALRSPHAEARGLVLETEHPLAGRVESIDCPIRTTSKRRDAHSAPPTLGQHSATVLAAMGVDEIVAQQLRRDEVIG